MKKYFILLFLIFCLSFKLHASTSILADSTYVKYNIQRFIFNGNVRLDSPSIYLTANQLEYRKNNLQAKGDIKLKLKQDDIDVSAQTLFREGKTTKLSNSNGFVLINDQKNKRDVKSKVMLIEDLNEGNKKIIHFQGEPILNEEKISATAEKEIIYNQKNKITYFMGTSKIEDKEKKSKIQSKDILFLEESQKLIFNNAMNITDEQNHFLSGARGDYDIQTKYLNMDTNVRYIGDVARINSDRLRTDRTKDKTTKEEHLAYFFEKNIKINYQTFVGTSRQILVEPEKNYTELIDNVYLKGTNNGLIVKCDLMDIMEKERKSYLYNNVKLIDGKRIFTSDIATYDDRTKIFTLRGNAKYVNDDSTYTAQTIYLNNNDLSIKFVGQVKGSSALEGLKGIKL